MYHHVLGPRLRFSLTPTELDYAWLVSHPEWPINTFRWEANHLLRGETKKVPDFTRLDFAVILWFVTAQTTSSKQRSSDGGQTDDPNQWKHQNCLKYISDLKLILHQENFHYEHTEQWSGLPGRLRCAAMPGPAEPLDPELSSASSKHGAPQAQASMGSSGRSAGWFSSLRFERVRGWFCSKWGCQVHWGFSRGFTCRHGHFLVMLRWFSGWFWYIQSRICLFVFNLLIVTHAVLLGLKLKLTNEPTNCLVCWFSRW